MAEKIYAYLDECGAYSPSTSNLDQEHLFIVCWGTVPRHINRR